MERKKTALKLFVKFQFDVKELQSSELSARYFHIKNVDPFCLVTNVLLIAIADDKNEKGWRGKRNVRNATHFSCDILF